MKVWREWGGPGGGYGGGPVGLRLGALVLICGALLTPAHGQALRFSNHREAVVPPYAVVRIGPFYSTVSLSQSAGYRWVKTSGTGTDFLFDNERGEIREDGDEFPLITTLTMRNYLLLTRRMDLDFSITATYRHFPMGTQEDDWTVDLTEEGIYGTLSATLLLTPYLRGTLYDNLIYKTDFVDARGIQDRQGGEEFEYFSNTAGLDLDWLLGRGKNVLLSGSRTDFLVFSDGFEDQERVEHRLLGGYQQQIFEGLVMGGRVGYTTINYDLEERPDTHQLDYQLTTDFGRGGESGAGLRLTGASTLKLALGYAVGYEASAGNTVTNETSRNYRTGDQEALTFLASLQTRLTRDLMQELFYEHGLRGGFASSFEVFERYGYALNYQDAAWRARIYTTWTDVRPGDDTANDYTDWTSGVDIGLPLTRFVTLRGSTAYSIRGNSGDGDLGASELDSDYETWNSLIGTEFPLTRKIRFSTYYQHVERYSDDQALEYQRDIFEALLTFTHQF